MHNFFLIVWLQELLFYCYRKRRKYDKIKIIINLYLKEQVNYCELAFFFLLNRSYCGLKKLCDVIKKFLPTFSTKLKFSPEKVKSSETVNLSKSNGEREFALHLSHFDSA